MGAAELGGICVASSLLLAGCGAMNPKPADSAGTAAASARCSAALPDPGDGSTVSLTDGSSFVINAHLANLTGDATKDSPKSGTLVIRGVHGSNLLALSKDTQFKVTYAKESTHPATHDPYPITPMTFQPDGTFSGAFSGIARPGTYDFVIKLSDGSDQDVHTFSFKIQ